MSKDHSGEQEQGFTVVDRRRFTESGEERPGVKDQPRPEPVTVTAPKAEPKPVSASSSRPQQVTEQVQQVEGQMHSDSVGDVDFSGFVISLATQAAVMMGDIPHPETGTAVTNFEAARQTIDILGLLELKTKGNLSQEEAKLLDDVLSSLRMAFVAKSKKGNTKQ